MVKVYAVVLAAGVVALITWVFLTYLGGSGTSRRLPDPEQRFGRAGRRVVGAMVGFGMAGMSAEFSPRDLSWVGALALALGGGALASWYAGRSDPARPTADQRPDGPEAR